MTLVLCGILGAAGKLEMLSLDHLKIEDLARINVVGVSGSGKSWVSKRLAEVLSSKCIELDQLYWGPNWTEPQPPEFRAKIEAATQCDHWVMDGNYHSKTQDIKWRDATMVVWIDNSFLRTVSQAFVRAVKRIWTKEEIWPGTNNRETFRKTFLSTDSVVMWILSKDESEVGRRQGACMMNWLISSLVYAVLGFLLIFVLVGIPMLVVLAILQIAFPIIAAIKAHEGKVWSYPLAIRFFDED